MRFLLSALMGLLVLGLVGAAGLVYLVDVYNHDLPDYERLKSYEPPVTTRVHAGDGRLLAEFAAERRVFVPINEIPKLVRDAFLSAEDKNFYIHRGIDPLGILRAVLINVENLGSERRPVGASTITQQVAKNMLLTNEVSITRKIKEAVLAFRLERTLTKERILELYLNEIFLGYRAYGVAAAAQNYFNKALGELTVAEAAYLAALPKAPGNYHPERRKEAALARRNWVISRMAEDGVLSTDEAKAATAEDLLTRKRDDSEQVTAEYFAEEVRREIAKIYGEEALYKGGLSVRSTMDPTLQAAATAALRAGLIDYDRRHGYRGPINRLESFDGWAKKLAVLPHPPGADGWKLAVVLKDEDPQGLDIGASDGERGRIPLAELQWARRWQEGNRVGPPIKRANDVLRLGDVVLVEPVTKDEKGKPYPSGTFGLRQIPAVQGGFVALDPHTGRVLAMAGGFSPQASSFNRATQAQRQPGSSIKPFVYLTALNNGLTPSSLVMDAPFEYNPGHGQPIWRPANYSHEFYGPTPLRIGIEKSRNVMTVRLAQYIGMDKVKETVEKFGIVDNLLPVLPMSLGAGETTVLRMTAAYGMIANGGKRIVPTFIDRVQDRTGKTIYRHDTRACDNCSGVEWRGQTPVPTIPDNRQQLSDPRTVYQITSIMEGVVQRGTATRLAVLKKPIAGKTGTTNDVNDAWFVGFTPDLAFGAYVGFDQPQTLGPKEAGGSTAVPIIKAFLDVALADKPATPFRTPRGLSKVRVNLDTGRPVDGSDKRSIWESFLPGTEPDPNVPPPVIDGSGQTGGEWSWNGDIPGGDFSNLSAINEGVAPAAGSPLGGSSLGGAPLGGSSGGAPLTGGAPLAVQPAQPGARRPQTPVGSGAGGLY
jgi:penicillin-binding protein 1A